MSFTPIITASEIYSLTGIAAANFTDTLLEYVEAIVESRIGFLKSADYTKEFYLQVPTSVIYLNENVGLTVTKVEYKTLGGTYSDLTIVTDYDTVLEQNGQLVFVSEQAEGTTIRVTGKKGWSTTPTMVKLLIIFTALDLLNNLHPGTVDFGVVSKTLAQFSVKYAISEDRTIGAIINDLIVLIKQGELEPGISI